MSAFVHILSGVGTLTALVLALGTFAWRVSRAVLLHRAGSAALKRSSEDERGKAALEIVEALTRREPEPWYRMILGRRKSAESEGGED